MDTSWTSAEDAWQAMYNAENAYYKARMAFVAAGPHEVLRNELGAARGRATALRVLADLLPDHTVALFAEVFEAAVGGERDVVLARHVLGRVDPARASEAFSAVMRGFLADERRDAWNYRRAAELLDVLGHAELLAQLVDVAKRSKDSGIREVGDDFSR